MPRSGLRNIIAGWLLVTLALAAVGLAQAQAQEPQVREFPPAILIEGSAQERGTAYGKQFQVEIRDFLEKEIYQPFVDRPASKEQLLEYAKACGEVVRKECPLVAAEIEGIAAGSELKFEEVILINLHEELYHRTELPKQGHCTAVAVGPPDSGNDHTYVGQTWDWMQSVGGKSRITQWRRDDGASVLAYGFPGMPMGAGVSSAGIALCWTSAALGDKSQSPRVGIPSYAMIQHLLAQPDMDSAIREAKKNKHAGWFTFVMADADGRLVNIEGSPSAVAVEVHEGRLARVDYGSRQMTGVKPDEPVRLHARCQKMLDMLQATRGKNELARLQDYFADPKHEINVGKATIDMMVFDTKARKAYLSRGTSYGLAWREFGFDQK